MGEGVLAEALVLCGVVLEAVELSGVEDGLVLLAYVLGLVAVGLGGDGFAALAVEAVVGLRLAGKCLCDVHE